MPQLQNRLAEVFIHNANLRMSYSSAFCVLFSAMWKASTPADCAFILNFQIKRKKKNLENKTNKTLKFSEPVT